MLVSADERLARARIVLERRGTVPGDLLAPDIAESWARCLAGGLDPQEPPPLATVDAAQLRAAREQCGAAMRLAVAEMQALYQQIAGTNFMVAFGSPEGVLIETIIDTSFTDVARRASLQPGTIWRECACGTNALGLVGEIRRAISVHGGEHFFNRHGGLTCAAAPVFGPDATLVGVLDASSDCHSRQHHTRALVAMAATQIENGLFRDQHGGHLVVAFHSRREYLRTLSAGLLAFDAEGRILGANARARFLLQGLPALPGRRFEDVFVPKFGPFVRGRRTHEAEPLQDRAGSLFVAMVEQEGAARGRPAASVQAGPRPDFIAEDPRLKSVLRQVEAAAARCVPILIRGETGTGKEHVARHAHAASGRRGTFVPVNCAALPAELIEAELFGHAEGAFTGARRGGSPGLLVEADGGTLLLDEIGDMPMALQPVLLRLLDDWTVRPVGGGRRRQVDVLLVAATNADLAEAVAQRRFRADLYYRLSTMEVVLPPLRERRDFAEIAGHHFDRLAPGRHLSAETIARLAAHHWPGNIRELSSVLTRIALHEEEANAPFALPDAPAPPVAGSLDLRTATQERILATYRQAGGNLSEAARQLNVSRNTVYRALRQRSAAQ